MPREVRQRTNGSTHVHFGALAGAGAMTLQYDDPLTRVLELDASSSSATRWLGYVLGAIALLLGLMVRARAPSLLVAMTDRARPAAPNDQEIDIMADEPPPTPPPTPEPEAKPEPAPAPPARPTPREQAPATPPAQAAKVLTQEPDPNEPVDLTGNTFVSGNAESFAGGDTAANGTGTAPGRLGPAPSSSPATKAVATAARAGPDRSRRPSAGATEWNAPFPPEADEAQINDTYVLVEVDLRSDGTASAVRVLKDPGYGFGRVAQRYALSHHYEPALDREGNPIASVLTLNIHYSR